MFVRSTLLVLAACAATVAQAQPNPGPFQACRLANGHIHLTFPGTPTQEVMTPVVAQSVYGITKAKACTRKPATGPSPEDKAALTQLIRQVGQPAFTSAGPVAGEGPVASTSCRHRGALVIVRGSGTEVLPGEAARFPSAPPCHQG